MTFGSGGSTVQRKRARIKHEFKGTADTQPTHIYVGLSLTDPTADGSGITEVTGTGYARQICDAWTESDPVSGDPASAKVVNTNIIDYGVAGSDWAVGSDRVAYWFTSDGLTGGNIRQVGAFNTPMIVQNGNPVQIAAGALTIEDQWKTAHS